MRATALLDCPPPVTFDKLASIRPWKFIRPDHIHPAWAFVGGSSRQGGYARCVAWYRGFPAVVGCTEGNWHLHHARFPVPVEALCFAACGWNTWGVLSQSGVYVSRITSGVRVQAKSGPMSNYEMTVAAFPNVRRCFGACGVWVFESLVHGNLDRQLQAVPA